MRAYNNLKELINDAKSTAKNLVSYGSFLSFVDYECEMFRECGLDKLTISKLQLLAIESLGDNLNALIESEKEYGENVSNIKKYKRDLQLIKNYFELKN